jgi:hypothetical protein
LSVGQKKLWNGPQVRYKSLIRGINWTGPFAPLAGLAAQQSDRVLAGVTADRTELVQDFASELPPHSLAAVPDSQQVFSF